MGKLIISLFVSISMIGCGSGSTEDETFNLVEPEAKFETYDCSNVPQYGNESLIQVASHFASPFWGTFIDNPVQVDSNATPGPFGTLADLLTDPYNTAITFLYQDVPSTLLTEGIAYELSLFVKEESARETHISFRNFPTEPGSLRTRAEITWDGSQNQPDLNIVHVGEGNHDTQLLTACDGWYYLKMNVTYAPSSPEAVLRVEMLPAGNDDAETGGFYAFGVFMTEVEESSL